MEPAITELIEKKISKRKRRGTMLNVKFSLKRGTQMGLLMSLIVVGGTTAEARSVQVFENSRLANSAPALDQIIFAYRTVPFASWQGQLPGEFAVMNLFPEFREPTFTVQNSDGTTAQKVDRLTIFVAQARFTLNKPANQVSLDSMISLDYLKQVDKTIEHEEADPARLINYTNRNQAFANPQSHRWCDGRTKMVCVTSTYKFGPFLSNAIAAVNMMGDKKKDAFSRSQSELRLIPPSEAQGRQLQFQALTGLSGPVVGGVEQNLFYFNQMIQFGKVVAIVQPHPTNSAQSVVSAYLVMGIETKWFELEKNQPSMARIARSLGLMPSDFLMGRSVANTNDNTIMAGLPKYGQAMVKEIADFMSR
jgi:hypothetical protein